MNTSIRALSLAALASFVIAFTPGIHAASMQGMGGDQSIRVQGPQAKAMEGDVTAEIESIVPGAQEKTVASGLYMSGMYTYGFTEKTASVTLDRIDNDSYTKPTKTLRLSFYATTYEPVRGAGLTGYRLVNFPTLSALDARHYYYDVRQSATYLNPPAGAYWLVLVLSEYNPAACPSNTDGYCLVDSINSISQVRFGGTPPTFNYTDMWWTESESGWGVSITQHSSRVVFVAWFTYDEQGKPKWYVSPNCELVGDVCNGSLYETTGSPFSKDFDPGATTARAVGAVTLSFNSYGAGTMKYTVGNVVKTKTITRQAF